MAFDDFSAMSLPRQILPAVTYLITRRAILRHKVFRPDSAMTQILVYVLCIAARRHSLQVHALCAMSTHLHLVVTDVQGKLPKFLQFFHRIVALCTKVHRGWHGPVWDKDPTSVVRLETLAAVVEKIAYVLANPVAAGLVRHAHEWPGAKVLVDEIGEGVLCAERPTVYLNRKNKEWIEQATLPISLPPGIDPEHADVFRRRVEAELERLEAQAHAEMQQASTETQPQGLAEAQPHGPAEAPPQGPVETPLQGRSFLGAERAMTVSPEERATNAEPILDRNPTFAVGRGPEQRDAFQRAVAALRAFRTSYRAALEEWRGGNRSVVFPAGTWGMHVFHGAPVHGVIPVV